VHPTRGAASNTSIGTAKKNLGISGQINVASKDSWIVSIEVKKDEGNII
jgi:hypothetical protein